MNTEVMHSANEDSVVVLHDPHEALLDETLAIDMVNLALSAVLEEAVTTDDGSINRQSSSSEGEDEDEYEDTNDEFDLGQVDGKDWFSSTVR